MNEKENNMPMVAVFEGFESSTQAEAFCEFCTHHDLDYELWDNLFPDIPKPLFKQMKSDPSCCKVY